MNPTAVRPKVVFFGSGPVATRSLELLLEWCDIEAVVTKPQPAHHKVEFPVITLAEKHGLQLHFTSNRRELDDLVATHAFESRVGVLIDFGIIVSQRAIDAFELGIVNSHFSLLPELRGADPITFSILSGRQETGVSLMLLVEAMDEGPLLAQVAYELAGDVTTPALTEDLIDLSNQALRQVLPLYIEGTALPVPQEQASLTGHDHTSYSRKLSKEDGILDFSKPAAQLEREIRAFIEWPRSRTTLAGKDIVITKAHVVAGNIPSQQPGDTDITTEPGSILIETDDGRLAIDMLKPAGKPEMPTRAFLAGNKL